jgi:hypothetical protein
MLTSGVLAKEPPLKPTTGLGRMKSKIVPLVPVKSTKAPLKPYPSSPKVAVLNLPPTIASILPSPLASVS